MSFDDKKLNLQNSKIKNTIELILDAQEKKASENDAKAGGSSLLPGSSEYREYVYDRMGMDEHEQEKAELERVNKRQSDDYSKVDKWHNDRCEKLANERDVIREAWVKSGEGRLSPTQFKVKREIGKSSTVDPVMEGARIKAAQTKTKHDDEYVNNNLYGDLMDKVYDYSKSEDDMQYRG